MLKLVKLLKVQIPKIIITHHKVVGDGCIWEGISLMNACWVSQLVPCQVLNPVSQWWCVLKKIFYDGEIIFQGWKTFVRVSIMHQKSFRGAQNILDENDYPPSIENGKAHFRYIHNFVHEFWKKVSRDAPFLNVGLGCIQRII